MTSKSKHENALKAAAGVFEELEVNIAVVGKRRVHFHGGSARSGIIGIAGGIEG